jgi:hypothetical protein
MREGERIGEGREGGRDKATKEGRKFYAYNEFVNT